MCFFINSIPFVKYDMASLPVWIWPMYIYFWWSSSGCKSIARAKYYNVLKEYRQVWWKHMYHKTLFKSIVAVLRERNRIHFWLHRGVLLLRTRFHSVLTLVHSLVLVPMLVCWTFELNHTESCPHIPLPKMNHFSLSHTGPAKEQHW